jgi:hypothetical protein
VHGFCVGISSGANLVAARRAAQRVDGAVVTIFPDVHAKYQSQGLRHCAAGQCRFEHDPVVAPSVAPRAE